MSDHPESYLQRNGIAFKKSGGRNGRELLIPCPICGREEKCSVNSRTWAWQCFVCEAIGGEVALKKAHGHMYEVEDGGANEAERLRDEAFARAIMAKTKRTDVERWADALQKAPEAEAARTYLAEGRHIALETCAELYIGWSPVHPDSKPPAATGADEGRRRRRRVEAPPQVEAKAVPGGTGWITIPSFTRHRSGRPDPTSCACVKLRSVPPAEKAYRRVTGGDSILYAPGGIDPTKTLILVGGELDAVVLHQLGVENVAAGTTGEKGWSDVWTKQLEPVEDIVVIYDGDETGKAGTEKLAQILGTHRTRIGSWPEPHKDANDALVALGDEFDVFFVQAIIAEARSVLAEGVVRIKGAVRDRYKRRHKRGGQRGVTTGWPHLDDALGGVRWGEVTVVTGDTSSGKTTFISDWCRHMASAVVQTTSACGTREAIPTLVCAFEMGEHLQLDKWVRQQSTHPPEELSEDQLDATLDQLEAMPLWMLRHWGTFSVEALRNTLVYAARRLGVRFVILDHLSFMVAEGTEQERAQIAEILMVCAEVAKDEDIHIVLVAHPHGTGTGKDKDRDNRIIQLGDLKGSTSIKQIAFNVLSVWRSRKSTREGIIDQQGYGEGIVYLLKVRSDYGVEGSVPFAFWFRAARFLDPDESTPLRFPKSKEGPADQRRHWTDDD